MAESAGQTIAKEEKTTEITLAALHLQTTGKITEAEAYEILEDMSEYERWLCAQLGKNIVHSIKA